MKQPSQRGVKQPNQKGEEIDCDVGKQKSQNRIQTTQSNLKTMKIKRPRIKRKREPMLIKICRRAKAKTKETPDSRQRSRRPMPIEIN